jgi:hypothetical protein
MATVNGSKLTPEQIASAAKQAGFPDSEIPLAVAIALAESGGDATAHNSTPPDDSYGLWQINMYGTLGPARRAAFALKSNEDLYNPLTNARAALVIRRTQSWSAWSVYTNGKYKQHMNTTEKFGKGVPVIPIPIPPFVVPNPGELLPDAIGEQLKPFFDWLNKGILRVAMFVGGGILIMVAIALMVSMNQRKVLGAAASVVNPVKKAGKLAKSVGQGAK